MKTNDLGLALLKKFEGLNLTVYLDVGGLPTVGYGHRTSLPVGHTIPQSEADDYLRADLAKTEGGVEALLREPVTSNQFSALVCLAYNIGVGALSHSTLLKDLQDNKVLEAAEEFLRWDKVKGVPVSGLTRRREAERELFLS